MMLLLSRKLNESFLVGGQVRVMVLKIKEGRVVLGIDAPEDVLILREELVDEGMLVDADVLSYQTVVEGVKQCGKQS